METGHTIYRRILAQGTALAIGALSGNAVSPAIAQDMQPSQSGSSADVTHEHLNHCDFEAANSVRNFSFRFSTSPDASLNRTVEQQVTTVALSPECADITRTVSVRAEIGRTRRSMRPNSAWLALDSSDEAFSRDVFQRTRVANRCGRFVGQVVREVTSASTPDGITETHAPHYFRPKPVKANC